MTKLTSQEYVDKGGTICPNCESNEIEGGSISMEDELTFLDVDCLVCHADWVDIYRLTSYDSLRTEEGHVT